MLVSPTALLPLPSICLATSQSMATRAKTQRKLRRMAAEELTGMLYQYVTLTIVSVQYVLTLSDIGVILATRLKTSSSTSSMRAAAPIAAALPPT